MSTIWWLLSSLRDMCATVWFKLEVYRYVREVKVAMRG